jgi:tellurite resistance protein TehA-like permease
MMSNTIFCAASVIAGVIALVILIILIVLLVRSSRQLKKKQTLLDKFHKKYLR